MRHNKRNKKEEKEQPFELPERFIPSYVAALPDWASQATEELVKLSNTKGSPGFEPGPEQAEQVEKMAGLGMSPKDIGAILRIETKLLQKYYKYELETAAERINGAVAKVALQMALSGAQPDMTKFWLKTRAGWKETVVKEVTGAGGGPVQFQEVKQKMLEAIDAEIIDVTPEKPSN
jgi:hypothetical protein